MNANLTDGATLLPNVAPPDQDEFVRFTGTEKASVPMDTTACADSLASMMANVVVVFAQQQDEPHPFAAMGGDDSRVDY